MSRFRIFVLLAALAALTTAFAACGGGGDGGGEDPKRVVESATLEGVESGNLDLSLSVRSQGDEAGDIDLAVEGAFQSQGKEELPLLGMSVNANGDIEGEAIEFEGDLTLLADRAFVGFEGKEYEVDPTTFGFVKSGFEQAAQEGSREGEGNVTACQKAAEGLEVGNFVDNLTSEDGVDVDGTATAKVSGDLNTDAAIDALIKLTETPACASQLEAAGPLPLGELEEARDEVAKAVKDAHVQVYVGEDDDIVRRVAAELTIAPQGSGEKVEMEFDLTLSEVNQEQEIAAPGNARPLEELFGELGVNPLELLEGAQSGDIGGVLEGLLEEGGSSGGGAAPNQQAYLECLESVKSAKDLQECASLAP